jgi:hypothetical protein
MMTVDFPSLVVWTLGCHAVGDFILQDDKDANGKATSHLSCLIHVLSYSIPLAALYALVRAPVWAWVLIVALHYAQDRWQLHLKWMRFWKQTPPDRWPVGPLCVDQAFHVLQILIVTQLIYL